MGGRGTSSLDISFFFCFISNALSSFFLFCARRLFHQGLSLGGIALDPFRAGGGAHATLRKLPRPLTAVPDIPEGVILVGLLLARFPAFLEVLAMTLGRI